MTTQDKHEYYLASTQEALSATLEHWLYTSISSRRFPHNVAKIFILKRQHISRCYESFEKMGKPLKGLKDNYRHGYLTTRVFAMHLSRLYTHWNEILSSQKLQELTSDPSSDYQKICLRTPFSEWLKKGGCQERYYPVRLLRKYIEKDCYRFFSQAAVHGSISTLDDAVGFSDMDLVFVINTESLINSNSLLKLRSKARQILSCTYLFDPLMHHGPFYISEIDLQWYPEPFFPTVLFKYSTNLLDTETPLSVKTRKCLDKTRKLIRVFKDFFENRSKSGFTVSNGYELEWVLASVMLLPALFLQCKTGIFRYKKDTFTDALSYFSSEEWEPVATASEIRSNLPKRLPPTKQVVFASKLLCWPGLIQQTAIGSSYEKQRAIEACQALGLDYPKRVLRFIEAIENII